MGNKNESIKDTSYSSRLVLDTYVNQVGRIIDSVAQ